MAIWFLLRVNGGQAHVVDVSKCALICDHCFPDFTQHYGIVCHNHVYNSRLLLSTKIFSYTTREWLPLDSLKNT